MGNSENLFRFIASEDVRLPKIWDARAHRAVSKIKKASRFRTWRDDAEEAVVQNP